MLFMNHYTSHRKSAAFFARAVRVMFDHAVEKQVLKPENRALVLAQDRPADLPQALEEGRPTHIEKWLSRDGRSISTMLLTSGGKLGTHLLIWLWEKYAGAGRRGTETAQFFGIAE